MSATSTEERHPPGSGPPGNPRAELMCHLPFSRMAQADVEQFIAAARLVQFAPDAVLLEPAMGPVPELHFILQGSVSGRLGLADLSGPIEYEVGDLFPVSAVLGHRAVSATYTANVETACLLLPAAAMHALAAASPPFADFLNHRVLQFLELSRRAVQAAYSSQALAEQSLEARLDTLPGKSPLTCGPDTPLAQALASMHERRVGSVLVTDAQGAALGILTRHDILGRVTLPQCALATPISEVMSTPIHILTTAHTLQDAALLMSRHGIRHVPVAEAGKVVNIVSERDLFALQRQSLKQVSTQIRAARDLPALQQAAAGIRRLARHLLGQGVHARQLTQLISHLNDLLTEVLVDWQARAHGLDMNRACWLAFGSEGRSEQTIATDQDNGLIYTSDDPQADRARWLRFASDVNAALDACGYPLCKGNVMASNPQCCLTGAEWAQRFAHWIEHGAPEDLLNASIYFDFRPLVGNAGLLQPLRATVNAGTALPPRFLKQLAQNALRQRVPLNWRGAIEAKPLDGQRVVDLKMHGTAIFVDAARLFALAQGISATGTRERCEAAAPAMRVPTRESQAWVSGFEFLQMLRLRVQLQRQGGTGAESLRGALHDANPNLIDIDSLNELDHRLLKETLRVARRLQQRMELDYLR
jgi:CBS domain-containing protein